MSPESTAAGWHALRGDAQTGPHTWEQLYAFARTGHLAPEDKVWHPTLSDWIPAGSVPTLFPQAAPPTAPSPAPVAAGSPPAAGPRLPVTDRSPGGRPGWLIPLVSVVALVLVLGGATGAFLLLRGGGDEDAFGDGGSGSAATDGAGVIPGTVEFKVVDPATVVATEQWGEVPVNQIGVQLAAGSGRADAERVAEAVGGAVVGEFEFLDLYQIETAGATEADLESALAQARATDGVVRATPNQPTALTGEIWGVRTSPFNDPVYDGANGDGYDLIGVDKAWTYIRGAGYELNPVQVGIVDTGIYKGTGEFGGEVNVITDPDAELADPEQITYSDGTKGADASGGHGTSVATIVGGDPNNGGPAGIAGPLGSKLTISNTNRFSAKYTSGFRPATPDPSDPTKIVWPDGQTYAFSDLEAIHAQVQAGATVINLSYGPEEWEKVDPAIAAVYKDYFTRMEAERPDIIFVAAAGNDGDSVDGSRYYPAGFALSNVITVGNVTNDGTMWKESNRTGQDFEVTLSAPGEQAVQGVDNDTGKVVNSSGGTSRAAPQVAAAAALLRSLNKDLTAEDIKKILAVSARKNPAGDPILAIDSAVLMVINLNRSLEDPPKPALKPEDLEKQGAIDAVAIDVPDAPNEYLVKGILQGVGPDGADVTIKLIGDGEVAEGEITRHVDAGGEVGWLVKMNQPQSKILVQRLDNGAGSLISLELIDLNGHWTGTFTFGTITLSDELRAQAEEDGCDLSQLDDIEGSTSPMTLDITANEGGGGTAVLFVDASNLGEDVSSEPASGTLTWSGNEFTIALTSSGGGTLKGRATRQGDMFAIAGSFAGTDKGITLTGTWKATR